jgi:hypothetical protein
MEKEVLDKLRKIVGVENVIVSEGIVKNIPTTKRLELNIVCQTLLLNQENRRGF